MPLRKRYKPLLWLWPVGLLTAVAPTARAQDQGPVDTPANQSARQEVVDDLQPAAEAARAAEARRVAPSAKPLAAKELRVQMPRLFADLANSDPKLRENARIGLMGISRLDLPAFEKLVRDNLPLVPAQAAALREIVTHVYLSGEEYPAIEGKGFLGVRLLEVNIVSRKNDPQAGVQEDNPFDPRRPLLAGPPTTGVLIVERMPGFCGARSLLDGDVVLGVTERPGVPIRNPDDMRETVTGFTAGETIRFQLLRQGQVIQVPITLDPLPQAADQRLAGIMAMQELIDERKRKAGEYWERVYSPLLKEAAG